MATTSALGLAALFRRRATRGQRCLDQRRAEIRLAAAAILEQVRQQRARAVEIDRIDDRAALFARADQPCAGRASRDARTWCCCGTASARAMSPAAMPAWPWRTSRRNTLSRLSWASAPSGSMADVISIYPEISNLSRGRQPAPRFAAWQHLSPGLKPAPGKRTQPARLLLGSSLRRAEDRGLFS